MTVINRCPPYVEVQAHAHRIRGCQDVVPGALRVEEHRLLRPRLRGERAVHLTDQQSSTSACTCPRTAGHRPDRKVISKHWVWLLGCCTSWAASLLYEA